MSSRGNAIRLFLLGGALPIVVFAIVEQIYGTLGGVIAGLIFGGGEIAWELWKTGKVQGITLLSNSLVLVLGLLSLWEKDGTFFKMQPAIFMLVFSGVFLVSSLVGRPFLLETAKKQNPNLPAFVTDRLKGMNVRIGFLFIALAGLSAYSAVYWSTAAWAALKAVGLPLLLGVYILAELLWVRLTNRRPAPPR